MLVHNKLNSKRLYQESKQTYNGPVVVKQQVRSSTKGQNFSLVFRHRACLTSCPNYLQSPRSRDKKSAYPDSNLVTSLRFPSYLQMFRVSPCFTLGRLSKQRRCSHPIFSQRQNCRLRREKRDDWEPPQSQRPSHRQPSKGVRSSHRECQFFLRDNTIQSNTPFFRNTTTGPMNEESPIGGKSPFDSYQPYSVCQR